VAALTSVEDGDPVDADGEVGRPEYQVRQNAARDLVDLRGGIAGESIDVGAVLLETDPDGVEEDEHRDSDDNAGGGDGNQDDAESLRGAEVHCPIVTP
jgi:hypothetical protein